MHDDPSQRECDQRPDGKGQQNQTEIGGAEVQWDG